MKIHFYETVFETARKQMTFDNMCASIIMNLSLNNSHNYIYEYFTSEGMYYILNEKNYEQFLDDNVTDIFVYNTIEESKTYKDNKKNNIIILEKEKEEDDEPNFYQEDNDDENKDINIIKIQEENFLKEKVKQTIINNQKQKIKESKMKQKMEEKDKIIQQNEIKINIQKEKENNNINYEDDIANKEIINIIEQNFEKFKEDLINESKIQTSQIVMQSKLKFEQNKEKDNEIETPSSVEIHNGCICNGCGEFPIVGIRYKCVDCKDFDYCQSCYEEKKFIHAHPFYKLRFMI